MLCEKCHQKPATVFFTQIICGIATKTSTCRECHEADNPGQATLRETECHYCGEKPAYRQVGYPITGEPAQLIAACRRCSKERMHFLLTRMSSILNIENFSLDNPDSLKSLRERVWQVDTINKEDFERKFRDFPQELEEHMKKWVKERDR